ncbi:MAG: TrkA family potassium uptake protein [Ignisphaera sp.]
MRVLIVGATDEALEIIRRLLNEGHEVIILDDNRSRIDKAVQELDVAAYMFSMIDLDTFQQAGIHKADMVLAIHPLDAVNILACSLAKHFNVPRIYAVVNSKESANMLWKLGLASNVLIKSRALSKALIELIYDVKLIELDNENYLVLATVGEGSYLVGKTIGDVEDEGVKVVVVLSDENTLINLDKNYTFKQGDKIVFIIRKDNLESFVFKR